MLSHLDRLTPSQRELWTEWDRLRGRGVPRKAMAKLRAFIDALKAGTEGERAPWVEALCMERLDVEAELDGPEPTPMPHPLFIEVVLPVLAARREQTATPWPRWLAQSDTHVWASATAAYAQLGAAHDSVALLRAAVAASGWRWRGACGRSCGISSTSSQQGS